jgi:dimethylargininase
MWIAVTREVSPGIGRCELTHLERSPIDVGLARAQHRHYEECLASLGCEVRRLPALAELPDSVFVEDAAVVLEEAAVIARPGAEPRRPETVSIAEALHPYRKLLFIEPPGTLDGGDVLLLEKVLYVGRSSRTDADAVGQMRKLVAPLGYEVRPVDVRGCLHLKSAVTRVGTDMLLINPDWVDGGVFDGWKLIPVHPSEPFGANALLVGERVVYPSAFPRTQARLEKNGIGVTSVQISELAKAEGGVTCCSLLVRA